MKMWNFSGSTYSNDIVGIRRIIAPPTISNLYGENVVIGGIIVGNAIEGKWELL